MSDPLFDEAWAAYPKKPNNSRLRALLAWQARRKEGESPAVMLAGVRAYADYLSRERPPVEPRFIKQAATFFGPTKPYADSYAAPPTKPFQFYAEDGISMTPEAAELQAEMMARMR